MGPTT